MFYIYVCFNLGKFIDVDNVLELSLAKLIDIRRTRTHLLFCILRIPNRSGSNRRDLRHLGGLPLKLRFVITTYCSHTTTSLRICNNMIRSSFLHHIIKSGEVVHKLAICSQLARVGSVTTHIASFSDAFSRLACRENLFLITYSRMRLK